MEHSSCQEQNDQRGTQKRRKILNAMAGRSVGSCGGRLICDEREESSWFESIRLNLDLGGLVGIMRCMDVVSCVMWAW